MGDPAITELFVLASRIGEERTSSHRDARPSAPFAVARSTRASAPEGQPFLTPRPRSRERPFRLESLAPLTQVFGKAGILPSLGARERAGVGRRRWRPRSASPDELSRTPTPGSRQRLASDESRQRHLPFRDRLRRDSSNSKGAGHLNRAIRSSGEACRTLCPREAVRKSSEPKRFIGLARTVAACRAGPAGVARRQCVPQASQTNATEHPLGDNVA